MHGHAAEFAKELRREGIQAEPLEESPQMELW
jgi:hypothetical protein